MRIVIQVLCLGTILIIGQALPALSALAATAPSTTVDARGNIVYNDKNGNVMVKIAKRGTGGANQRCNTVGKGGLRYNYGIHKMEYCDGAIWRTHPEVYVEEGATVGINYPGCTNSFDTWRSERNAYANHFVQYGGPYKAYLDMVCTKNQMFVGSDLAPAPLPSSYINSTCCPIGIIAK